jgi:hypothetical protein
MYLFSIFFGILAFGNLDFDIITWHLHFKNGGWNSPKLTLIRFLTKVVHWTCLFLGEVAESRRFVFSLY